MFVLRFALIVTLFAGLSACEKRMECNIEGTWRVERLGCTGHPNARPAHVDATYTFSGERGTTRWELPGCTVEAEFDISVDGTDVRVRERRHTCQATPLKEGQDPTPCCTSAEVDVDLAYRCQLGPEGVNWMATLRKEGARGPWADKGAWRGCPDGSLGMMRLIKH